MLLVDHELKSALSVDSFVKNYDPSLIGPNSLDVRLGNQFKRFNYHDYMPVESYVFDPRKSPKDDLYNWTEVVSERILLQPGEFILASLVETLALPNNMYCELDGKSTIARTGLQIHSTAGFIDSGFRGSVVLEILNTLPCQYALWAGQLIGQIRFFLCDSPEKPYDSTHTYHGQRGTVEANTTKLYKFCK